MLIPVHYCILPDNGNSLHFELIIQPELQRSSVILQFHLKQILRSVFKIYFLPSEELSGHERLRLLVRIQRSKLGTLFRDALQLAFVLFANHGQKFPGQEFAVDKEIVVQNDGRGGEQIRLFVFFISRAGTPPLIEKLVIRNYGRLG